MTQEERQTKSLKAKEERQAKFLKVENLVLARNTSLYKVTKDLGLPVSLFSDWKSGKSMPKADKLLMIANYFGVDIGYFLE